MARETDDNIFSREMKRIKLASKYPVSKNKLPLKKAVDLAYRGRKVPRAVEVRVSLRDAALMKKIVEIQYQKTTTNELKTYRIEPYSYRYLKLKVGVRKMVFGWDTREKKIKSFAMRNIRNAKISNLSFSPRFPIEIGRTIRKKTLRKLGK